MTEERRIGTLRRVSGHTFDTVYDLLFTTERVIALIVEHPGDLPQRFGIAEMLVGGRLSGSDERAKRKQIADERLRLYEERDLDGLACLHRLNFEIPYARITSAEVRRGLLQTCLTFCLAGSGRTIRFRLRKAHADEAKRLADQIHPGFTPAL